MLEGMILHGAWRMNNGYDRGTVRVTIVRADEGKLSGVLSLSSEGGCTAKKIPYTGEIRETLVSVDASFYSFRCSPFLPIWIRVTFDAARGLPVTGTMSVNGFDGTLTLDRDDAPPPSPYP